MMGIISLDMYRKVPADLLNGTKRGSLLSIMAVVVMVVLFTLETRTFLRSVPITTLSLDKPTSDTDTMVRINFNITMMDMPCSYAVIDVISNYGTEQNVTKHITKMQVDAEGVNQRYHSHPMNQQHDLILWDETVTQTLEEMIAHDGEEDAVSLTPETFDTYRNTYKFLFVDFYAR
jgi:hypothetical protein